MKIADRELGPGRPPYVIAELGVNHDGSVDRALQLTDAAAEAGAEAIKLQLFQADLLMSKAAKLAAYQQTAGESDPVEMLRRLELSIEQMAPVVARAHARGIHAIVTVFSVELIEQAEQLPWNAYKTASPDIIHAPLLDRLEATGKPLIVSTGASTMAEIERAVVRLRPAWERLALLQCVSAYPTPPGDAAIEPILQFRERFPRLAIGYSDHTTDLDTAARAVSLGACVLEKHLTWSHAAPGPDHAASAEPRELARYVELARRAPRDCAALARGHEHKLVRDCERDVRSVSRQSLTATRHLPAGHRLSRTDLTFKRPGSGIPPFMLDETLGRILARAIDADMPIMETDLAPS